MSAEAEQQAIDAAFQVEREVVWAARHVHVGEWALAKSLHALADGQLWLTLGYESLEEFLARPELGMSKARFNRLSKLWRDLVEVRKVPPARVATLDPAKVAEVVRAVMSGDVSIKDALDDVEALGSRDLRTKYRPKKAAPGGSSAPPVSGGKEQLDAEQEPEWTRCPTCKTWVDPAAIGTHTHNDEEAEHGE